MKTWQLDWNQRGVAGQAWSLVLQVRSETLMHRSIRINLGTSDSPLGAQRIFPREAPRCPVESCNCFLEPCPTDARPPHPQHWAFVEPGVTSSREAVMSLESAKQFLVKISTDEEAAAQADEAYNAALLKLATGLGFQVSPDDLRAAMADLAGELSDAELDHVAGGAFTGDTSLYGGGGKFFHRTVRR